MEKQIIKYLEGESSREEKIHIIAWIRSSEDNLNFFLEVKSVWKDGRKERGLIESRDLEDYIGLRLKMASEVKPKMTESADRGRSIMFDGRVRNVISGIASVVIIVLLITSVTLYSRYNSLDTTTHIFSESGQVSKVELPDGSIVWLNSNSEIEFTPHNWSDNREVTLDGEAYFSVSKSIERPFYVKSRHISVEVTGTKFDVSAYSDGESVDVILEEGGVTMHSNYGSEKLAPGSLGSFSVADGKFEISKVNTAMYTSWKDGIVTLVDCKIEDLVKILNRRFNVDIIIEDSKIDSYTYTLDITDDSLETLLLLMSKMTPISYGSRDGKIYIEEDRLRRSEFDK